MIYMYKSLFTSKTRKTKAEVNGSLQNTLNMYSSFCILALFSVIDAEPGTLTSCTTLFNDDSFQNIVGRMK